jgi:tetratricopeptide (TPR) repeat protein
MEPVANYATAAAQSRRRLLVLALVALGAVLVIAVWFWVQHPPDRENGLRLVEQGRFDEAEPLLVRALEHKPNDVEVLKALALGELPRGKLAEAEAHLASWCALRPSEVEPYQDHMVISLQQRHLSQALADGRHILELEPGNADVRSQVAKLYLLKGQLDDAEHDCRRCLQADPDNPDLLYLLADICHQRGKKNEAEAILEPLLKRFPDDASLLLLRGILYNEADQPAQAIVLLQKVLASPGATWQRSTARYHLSLALARTGQNKEAERLMAEVQQEQAMQHVRMAMAGGLGDDQQPRTDEGQLQQAMHNLALRDSPNIWALIVRMAEAQIATGNSAEATRLLERVLAKDPNWSAESVRLLKKILEKEPNCAAAHRLLADWYERQGQTAQAEEHRRQANP